MEQGIRLSLRKRPYTNESFRTLVSQIERDIQKRRKREIKSDEIGEVVMHQLRTFDKVGYIRFASIYRSFTDISGFAREIQSLEKKKKK
jgi:transcriptional repressor NrdR